jgi:multiple sugar transport system ATP-binding protein
MAEVKLDRLRKRIGKVDVIADLSLTVHDGELFTLVGPSGCGKSTLLHLIAGLESPTDGRIYFDGENVTDRSPRDRDVALVFQSYALYPHMTVRDNLSFPLRVGRRHDGAAVVREVQRVAEVLGLEGLLERRPRELSGGQRQRVALGRAIIRHPRVFLLDEPLSNLDAQLRADMRAELRRLHDQLGITTIYVTHDQTEALTLADRLGVLDHGRIQQVGTVQDVYVHPQNLFVARFIGQPPMNLFKARLEHGRIVAEPLLLSVPESAAEIRHTTNADHLGSMQTPLLERGEVIVGFRPEMLQVTETKAGGRPGYGLEGRVLLVEPGAGQFWISVQVRVSNELVTVIGMGRSGVDVKLGSTVLISFQDAVPYLFDRATGLRLDLEPAQRSAAWVAQR